MLRTTQFTKLGQHRSYYAHLNDIGVDSEAEYANQNPFGLHVPRSVPLASNPLTAEEARFEAASVVDVYIRGTYHKPLPRR